MKLANWIWKKYFASYYTTQETVNRSKLFFSYSEAYKFRNSIGGNARISGNSESGRYTVDWTETIDRTHYSQGSYIGEVTAAENAYTNNARNSDGYWYVRDRLANTAPFFVTPSEDKDLGARNKAFVESFSVDDTDLENSLTVTIRLNGTQIGQFLNATRKSSYNINITDELIKTCPLNKRSTINVELTDGTVTTNRNWYFTRSNSLPTVKVTNENLGEQNKELSFSFTADDADGDVITGKIYIDGIQIKDLGEVTKGRKITETISRDDFIKLKNGEHKIRIDITDSKEGVSSAYVTFSKNVTWYKYELKHKVEDMATDIRVDLLAELKKGVKVTVQVCNNALDSAPRWETIEPGAWAKFSNKTKTNASWAIGVKIEILKGSSVGVSRIFGHNTSFA